MTIANDWLDRFAAALARHEIDGFEALFLPDCFWRDFLAFTWTLETVEGVKAIRDRLAATLADIRPGGLQASGPATTDAAGTTTLWFTFETRLGRGVGQVRLRDGRCHTLFTALRQLKGFEEPSGRTFTRERGVQHGAFRDRESWAEKRAREAAAIGRTVQPYCLIVGGGQGGLALAARLRRLGVPALIVEALDRPGDSWRRRYRSLCLHDPVWYDHLPYIPFPDHWPIFTPKDRMADWLAAYAGLMELDVWCRTRCLQAAYDEAAGKWRVTVDKDGEEVVLRPAHLVIATGMSGRPRIPDLKGSADFQGRYCHSSGYAGTEEVEGKECVVLGANNSAHDIAADLWERGARVTMVQRSPTIVARSEMLMKHAWKALYSEQAVANGITTEIADLTLASLPLRLAPKAAIPVFETIAREDAELYRRLGAAGFRSHFGEDGSGIQMAYLRTGGGYYIDVGASELIATGEIAVRPGEIERLEAAGPVLTDGTRLEADLLVAATGYGPMSDWAADLISEEVARKVGRVWGMGSGVRGDPGPWEGELRNMWKPTAVPGLWFMGGNLMQARHYSLYLALQLKACFEKLGVTVRTAEAAAEG